MYDTAGSAKIIAEQQLKGAKPSEPPHLTSASNIDQARPRLTFSTSRSHSHTDTAAIASELAGQHFGLDVLEKNIEDDDSNFTRFLLLSRQPISSLIPPNVPAKTSIVFITPNTPGALYKVRPGDKSLLGCLPFWRNARLVVMVLTPVPLTSSCFGSTRRWRASHCGTSTSARSSPGPPPRSSSASFSTSSVSSRPPARVRACVRALVDGDGNLK
jgi:hypothetical protein